MRDDGTQSRALGVGLIKTFYVTHCQLGPPAPLPFDYDDDDGGVRKWAL